MSRPLAFSRIRSRYRNHESGMSLTELLVVFVLMVTVTVTVAGLIKYSTSQVAQGSARMGMHQKSRTVIDRLSPILITAVSDGGGDGLAGHGAAGLKTKPSDEGVEVEYLTSIRFTTTEDFLNPSYDPQASWDFLNPTFYTYDITFVPNDEGNPDELGRIELRRVINGVPVDDPQPRVLAHGIRSFLALRLGSHAVEIEVRSQVGKREYGKLATDEDEYEVLVERAIVPIATRTF